MHDSDGRVRQVRTSDDRVQHYRGRRLERLMAEAKRKTKLTLDEVAALAWAYDAPYNSYGKLQAYIYTYDALPPKEFLRKNRKRKGGKRNVRK